MSRIIMETVCMPSNEMLELAQQKGSVLKENQQIRLTEDDHSYWILNIKGKLYLGREPKGKCIKFFKFIKEYEMRTGGELIYYVTPIYKGAYAEQTINGDTGNYSNSIRPEIIS